MEYSNALYCDGPGTFHEILAHPTDPINKAIELWVGFEHRFAFFYWARWFKSMRQKRPGPPSTLVTFDHHRDLMRPGLHEKLELEKVPEYTPSELANFVWARMNSNNDGHILSAVYLDLIEDVFVLNHQGDYDNHESHGTYDDINGKPHQIHEYDDYKLFAAAVQKSTTNNIFLDIDMDFCVSKQGDLLSMSGWEYFSESQIRDFFNPHSDLFKFIYKRLAGMTFALEPEHCGGLRNSLNFLRIIDDQFWVEKGVWR